ncbi:hypothetical protein DF122_37215 [Burkholderia pseudomallei]|nr:hypothetical protein DF122_37215 [Burkholderia pseudomallei]
MFWESFHKVTFSVSQLSILPVQRQTVQKARGSRSPACSPPGFLAASACAAPPLLSYACACMGPRRARTSASARCAAHPRPLGITSIRFPQFQAPRAPALTIMN